MAISQELVRRAARLTVRRLLIVMLGGGVPAVSIAYSQDEDRPLFQSQYRVINVHRHCDAPSKAALQAELQVMDRVGIDVVVNLLMDGGWTTENLPQWIELKKKHPKRLVVFGYIDWSKAKQPGFSDYLVQEVRAQQKLGAQGVKVWKDLGMYVRDAEGKLLKADDARIDPFWAACAQLGLPVLFHCADPREYWHPRTYNSFHYGIPNRPKHYEDPKMPSWDELMRQRDAVLKKHPRLIMIGAHMGSMSFDLARAAKTLDKYPNFYVECAARLRILGRLNPRAVRDFFVKYQDRVLFGTDSSMLYGVQPDDEEGVRAWRKKAARFESRYLEYFETDHVDILEPYGHQREWLRMSGVKLPRQVLEKFYHANAERIVPGLRYCDSPLDAEEKLNSPPQGFQALFNGQNLDNWNGQIAEDPRDIAKITKGMTRQQIEQKQQKADAATKAHWKVEDGLIHFDGARRIGNLESRRQFRDFEMYLDWKIPKGGDSGIFPRNMPQIQIWDPAGGKRNVVGSGGLDNNGPDIPPKKKADHPVGQWNTFYIKMVGDRIWVKLNGQTVIDGKKKGNYWKEFKSPPPAAGPIVLQSHGSDLWFRNIYIRELGEHDEQ